MDDGDGRAGENQGMTYPLPIVRPSIQLSPAMSAEFERILYDGKVTNNGPWVQKFEAALTDYTDVPTICFCNGTTAIMAMLKAAGIGPACEVICPSFTFQATPQAIKMLGAWPVYADIRSDTLTLDPEDVRRKITPWTKAVLGVDVYGLPCAYDDLYDVVKGKGVKLLMDSAPAFGATWNGLHIGGAVDAHAFSFHATKPFQTMEGGAIISCDPRILEKARAIRNFGQSDSGGQSEYGLNGKMMEICAMVGLEQLPTYDLTLAHRRRMAEWMMDGLRKINGICTITPNLGAEPIWTYIPILVDPSFGMTRSELCDLLQERYEITVRKYYPACHLMFRGSKPRLPITEDVAERVLSLPLYNDITIKECDRIVGAIEEIGRGA